MSHEIEMNASGRHSFAFTGARSNIWHSLGQELPQNATLGQWEDAAGFNFRVAKVPALASLAGPTFDHLDSDKRFAATDMRFIVREDNGHVLGFASDGYQVVQPMDVLEWFDRYITVDERFHLDAAGVLYEGQKLWATARFGGDLTVAGDSHIARLLMSTSFDSSQPTRNEATTTRVVCRNTLRAAHMNAKACIKTTHRSQFQGAQVARELAQIAQSFVQFKAMGDAMAQQELTRVEVQSFFAKLLDIPVDAKPDDISGRKRNIAADLVGAYNATKRERNTQRDDVWSALQAVTRYVDHDRTVRGSDGTSDGLIAARFEAGTFGSGDDMKGKALNMLLPMVDSSLFRDRVLIPA
jgi:phage/plasmid-like protein (TIGR03299 family)